MLIQTKPEPYCPACGAKMVLRRPKPGGKDFRPFWGCSQFPDCNATRNIMEDGKPEDDDEYLDEEMDWHPGHPSNYGDK